MLYVNGPGFQGLYAGDTIAFTVTSHGAHGVTLETQHARVAPLLVFADHVVVTAPRFRSGGHVVDASNFVRLVRRGRRHMQADCAELARVRAETGDARLDTVDVS